MVIFHSYVNVYQRVTNNGLGLPHATGATGATGALASMATLTLCS